MHACMYMYIWLYISIHMADGIHIASKAHTVVYKLMDVSMKHVHISM